MLDLKKTITSFSSLDIKSSHHMMLVIVFTLGILNLCFGELIPAGNGIGYDGTIYAKMVRDLYELVGNGELSPYYAHRILAPTINRLILDFAGLDLTDQNLIRSFEVYNLSLLLCCTAIWKWIADIKDLGLKGRWVGFAGLFMSFMGSKMVFYIPVSTDVTGFFIAMISLYFYLSGQRWLLFIISLIGSFAWPLVAYCGFVLILLMPSKLECQIFESDRQNIYESKPSINILNALVVLFIVSFLAVVILEIIRNYGVDRILGVATLTWMSLLTGVPSAAGVLIALFLLFGNPRYFIEILRVLKKSPKSTRVLSFLVIAIPSVIFWWIGKNYKPELGISNPNNLTILGVAFAFFAAGAPGKFFMPVVTLVAYWGPLVILLCMFWKMFCIQARLMGPGFVGVIFLILPLGLATEPRFITFAWPFLVLGAALVLDKLIIRRAFWIAFGILVILFGQFWLKINLAPWPGTDYEYLFEYPKQVLFMHLGMWMGWPAYLAQTVVITMCTLWLVRLLMSNNKLSFDDN